MNNTAITASAASTTKVPKTRAPNASKGKSVLPAHGNSTKSTAIRISSSPEASEVDGSDSDDDEILTDASLPPQPPQTDSRRERVNSPLLESDTEIGVPLSTPLEAPPIPTKLLNKLLHEGFEDEEMRIGKEAMAVAGKYVDIFVREAMARAVSQRKEDDKKIGGVGDGFLQVEDLEKQAPQLLLDF
ncbi:hypothetical protein K490DRAFT_46367 [Saccharata proteae CBS 121410]|uniref:Uncharacterized protein n=1 Tax=Saccharata proteae CBS 121410 TaxID=1314787 RepID=A0A9P4LWX7_9PEZI|nr:hypothetical protein K490DRAFT_46367 [Saccharata proteae CBS 121410]